MNIHETSHQSAKAICPKCSGILTLFTRNLRNYFASHMVLTSLAAPWGVVEKASKISLPLCTAGMIGMRLQRLKSNRKGSERRLFQPNFSGNTSWLESASKRNEKSATATSFDSLFYKCIHAIGIHRLRVEKYWKDNISYTKLHNKVAYDVSTKTLAAESHL